MKTEFIPGIFGTDPPDWITLISSGTAMTKPHILFPESVINSSGNETGQFGLHTGKSSLSQPTAKISHDLGLVAYAFEILEHFRTKLDSHRSPTLETGNTSTIENKDKQKSDHIKSLVEKGLIGEARNYLNHFKSCDSPVINDWRKVLVEPEAKTEALATGKNVSDHIEWIKTNSEIYKGKWVALKNGKLLSSHENRVDLHNSLKQNGKLSGALFFKMGD